MTQPLLRPQAERRRAAAEESETPVASPTTMPSVSFLGAACRVLESEAPVDGGAQTAAPHCRFSFGRSILVDRRVSMHLVARILAYGPDCA